MQSRYLKIFLSISFFVLMHATSLNAQLSVTGPVCVINGTEYQYDISRDLSDSSKMTVCITGGKIAHTDSTCRNGGFFSFIRVIWNDSLQGHINIYTMQDSISIDVNMTKALQGGKIDYKTNFQIIKSDSIPLGINCSAAIGGSCLPIDVYQWEQSADGMNWDNISGAISEQLEFSSPLSQTTYYRRKVQESVSGSENFSDIAIILVTAETPNNP